MGLIATAASPGSLPAVLGDALGSIGDIVRFAAPAAHDHAGTADLFAQLAAGDCDRYLFVGTEDVADLLPAADRAPSFLVPGPDAMARPDRFWQRFVYHRALCFSRPLHERLQRLSCATSYFQHFPDPGDGVFAADALTAIFVEEPQRTEALPQVMDLARQLGVRRLRVESRHREACTETAHGIEVTIRSTPAEAGDTALFHFFAGGTSHGAAIAHAMATGRIVVAPDDSLAADYCAHLVSGLLHAPDAAKALPRRDAHQLAAISRAARRKAVSGRRDWERDVDRLQSIVAGDGRRWSTSDCSAHFDRAIRAAAHRRAWHG